MSTRMRLYYRDIPGGVGINDATATVKKHTGDVAIISRDTAGSGARAGGVAFSRQELGYPGPVWAEITANGQRKVDSGTVITQVGPYWLDDVPPALAAIGEGPITGLQITTAGTMVLSVSAGSGIFKDGLPYVLEAAQTVGTVSAAHATNPRIDRVVLRQTRIGQGEEGKYEWLILPGTAAASPLPPNIVRDSQFWDFSFAQVRVEAGATSIASDKLTDERYSAALGQSWVRQWPAGLEQGDLLTVDAAGKLLRLDLVEDGSGIRNDYVLVPDAGARRPTWALLNARDRRGFFEENASQSAADTANTTNTSTSVLALQLGVAVPRGTWLIKATGGIALLREAATPGQSYFAIEVEGDEQNGFTLNIATADYQSVVCTRSVSGMPGDQNINIRMRYRSVTSGRTHARNPWLRVSFERTG